MLRAGQQRHANRNKHRPFSGTTKRLSGKENRNGKPSYEYSLVSRPVQPIRIQTMPTTTVKKDERRNIFHFVSIIIVMNMQFQQRFGDNNKQKQ